MTEKVPPPARPRSRPAPSPDNLAIGTDSIGGAAANAPQLQEPAFPIAMTLFPGEVRAEAEQIALYLLDEIQPSPGLERLITESIINHTREIALLEKTRVGLARRSAADQLRTRLREILTDAEQIPPAATVDALVSAWLAGSIEAEKEIERRFRYAGMRFEAVMLTTQAGGLEDADRISTMIGKAEHRRDRLIRTLQGNRALVAALHLRELQGRRMEIQIAGAQLSLDHDRDGTLREDRD